MKCVCDGRNMSVSLRWASTNWIAALAESIAVRIWRRLSKNGTSKWLYFGDFFSYGGKGLRNYVAAEWWWSKEQFIPATLPGFRVKVWKTMETTLKHLNAFIGLFNLKGSYKFHGTLSEV